MRTSLADSLRCNPAMTKSVRKQVGMGPYRLHEELEKFVTPSLLMVVEYEAHRNLVLDREVKACVQATLIDGFRS